jgi:hypothetical protein
MEQIIFRPARESEQDVIGKLSHGPRGYVWVARSHDVLPRPEPGFDEGE